MHLGIRNLTGAVVALALAATAVALAAAAPAGAVGAGDAYDYLVAQHSGKCVDVAGVSTADGAPVQQWTCLGYYQHNQQFHLVQVGTTPWFQIVAAHSGKCLDVTGGSTADGAPIQQYTCLGAGQYNQQFRFKPMPGGRFEIVARHDKKCLDVTAVSTADGARLQQWTCLGANQTNQLFAVRRDVIERSGSAEVDQGAWHQQTSASLVEEQDSTTHAPTGAYVIATTNVWSDGPFGFKGHTTVALTPSNVVTPTLPGQPTGVSGFGYVTDVWGSPTTTAVPTSIADGTTAIVPHSAFS